MRVLRLAIVLTVVLGFVAVATIAIQGTRERSEALAGEFRSIERYSGAVAVYSRDTPLVMERKFTSSASDEAILAHYEDQFRRNGWTKTSTRTYEGTGTEVCYVKGALQAAVIAWASNPTSFKHGLVMASGQDACGR